MEGTFISKLEVEIRTEYWVSLQKFNICMFKKSLTEWWPLNTMTVAEEEKHCVENLVFTFSED